MAMSADPPALDRTRIIVELDRCGVDYLLIGGVAANAYGASRQTIDFDCLVQRNRDNLDRLAVAMRGLNSRLRVEGLTDDEAKELPVRLTAATLDGMEISTWSTDAGPLDILTDMPARDGTRRRYEDLLGSAVVQRVDGTLVRLAGLLDIIASKEWANRPKDQRALPELREIAAHLLVGEPER